MVRWILGLLLIGSVGLLGCPPGGDPGADDDDTGGGPGSDDDDVGSDHDWAMPPAFEAGDSLVANMTCGYASNTFSLTMNFDGTDWTMIPPDGVEFVSGVEVCVTQQTVDVGLVWTDEPVLRFTMANIDHTVAPTDTLGGWFGEAAILTDTPECDAALKANGLTRSVNLTLTLDGIPPE